MLPRVKNNNNLIYEVPVCWATLLAMRMMLLMTIRNVTMMTLTMWLGMWRSSHSNSTTFDLRTFSADSKFVEFFRVPTVEFEPQVYTIGTTCLSHRNKCGLPNSLKGPKIILDMADRHVSKDGPFRILGNALFYFRTSSVSLFFIFYHRHVNVWLNSHSHLNGFVLWNSHSTNVNFSWLRHIPNDDEYNVCVVTQLITYHCCTVVGCSRSATLRCSRSSLIGCFSSFIQHFVSFPDTPPFLHTSPGAQLNNPSLCFLTVLCLKKSSHL